jgi:hypothetical protein
MIEDMSKKEDYEDATTIEGVRDRLDKALSEGATIIRDTPTTLLLDLDSDGDLRRYKSALPRMQRNFRIVEKLRYESKTPGHYHVVLKTSSATTIYERIALQAMLGSDPIREAMLLVKIQNGVDPADANVLFRFPEEVTP